MKYILQVRKSMNRWGEKLHIVNKVMEDIKR